MSIRVVCPSCRKVYNLAETMAGKTVSCRECQSPIDVPPLARKGRREEASRASEERIATSTRPASAASRAGRDEDDDPRSRPSQRRSRREDKDAEGGKNLVPILVGVGAAVLVLVGLVIGGIVLAVVGLSGSNSQPAPVTNEPAPLVADGRADAAAPPVAPPTVPINAPPAAPVNNPPAVPGNPPPAAPAKEAEPPIPAGPVPTEIATDVVKKVKQSTAYLRVTLPGGDIAQGSGFFALERGMVITNAHVVGMKRANNPPRSVDVVIHSGEAGETRLPGTLLGVDREHDLAVLRVQGDPARLPPPLPVIPTANELTETQNVYIFGFPFGAELGKNITISTSSISSLRRENGALKRVQVNGGMQPGNSGGPVTDARGVVIGVSVAIIEGTQINFAVPADFIRPLLEQSKKSPLDLTPRPGPFARNDPPAGPGAGAAVEGDLAALKGTWQSGAVGASGGGLAGLRISISPQPGGLGGKIQLRIAVRQGARTNNLTMNYPFSLEQAKGERLLVCLRPGPRGTIRGMVFIYRFEGAQLVLSGVIVNARNEYGLKNVPLRRVGAEPEMADANPAAPAPGAPRAPGAPGAPAAGAKAKGSPNAVIIKGDVYSFVAEAVRDNRLVDVDIQGFKASMKTYRDVCEEGGVLIGFQVGLGKFTTNDIVKSLRPIFLTKNGEKFGNWQGAVPAAPITVKAKPGYVVSEVSLRSMLAIDALRLTFAKLGKDGVDIKDNYNSEWVGGDGGRPSSIGGKGALFVGATGHLDHGGAPCSLGLVAVLPKDK